MNTGAQPAHGSRLDTWGPWVTLVLSLSGLGQIAQNTVVAMAVVVQGAVAAAIWFKLPSVRNRYLRGASYLTIVLSALAMIAAVAASGSSFKSDPSPGGSSAPTYTWLPTTASPTTTEPTTTTTTTTSETETSTVSPPPSPPRLVEEATVALGDTVEFFSGDLLIGFGTAWSDYATLTVTTRGLTCRQYVDLGAFVDTPGKTNGQKSWFRLTLLKLSASSITLRAEELAQQDWPDAPSLSPPDCPR